MINEDLIKIKIDLKLMKLLIPVLIIIAIFIFGIIVNSIKESTNLQYEKIENKLDAIKENNY